MSGSLLVATHNAGKLREVRQILEPDGWKVLSADDVEDLPDVEETGTTFEENATLKARAAASRTGLPALADDSGLEVDALDGAPGVFSARYAGPDATDADRIAKLLAQMEKTTDTERRARFVCAIAACRPDGTCETLRATCEGTIVQAPRGDGGFGYDPVFLPDGENQTFAELPAEKKNAISHRGRALARLSELLGRLDLAT